MTRKRAILGVPMAHVDPYPPEDGRYDHAIPVDLSRPEWKELTARRGRKSAKKKE